MRHNWLRCQPARLLTWLLLEIAEKKRCQDLIISRAKWPRQILKSPFFRVYSLLDAYRSNFSEKSIAMLNLSFTVFSLSCIMLMICCMLFDVHGMWGLASYDQPDLIIARWPVHQKSVVPGTWLAHQPRSTEILVASNQTTTTPTTSFP